MLNFDEPGKEDFFEIIAGKGENAGNQYFLCFPIFSLPYRKKKEKK